MKKILSIFILLFLLTCFLYNTFAIDLTLPSNTATSVENVASNTQGTSHTVVTDAISSEKDNFFTAENIISILLIVVGIVLILLGIAILTKIK